MNIDFGDFSEGRRKPCTSIVSPQVIKKHPAKTQVKLHES